QQAKGTIRLHCEYLRQEPTPSLLFARAPGFKSNFFPYERYACMTGSWDSMLVGKHRDRLGARFPPQEAGEVMGRWGRVERRWAAHLASRRTIRGTKNSVSWHANTVHRPK